MNFTIFAELIELKAKTASVFPFLLGLAYSLFHYQTAKLVPLVIYFVAMFAFNCFVDIWDNYNDYHNAVDTADYKQNTNIIGRENLSLTTIKLLLASFFGISLVLGIVVALMTGWAVFWLGLICYFVGIFYAAGPKPLSSLPVGEVASGFVMGYLIFLICVYINLNGTMPNIPETLLVAAPSILLIANLMLANNTCDLDEDEANERYTVVHYIGRRGALIWWQAAVMLAFLAIFVAVALELVPLTMLAMLFLIPLIVKFAKPYLAKQVKRETFISSVKILMIFSLVQTILMFLGLLIK